MTEILDIFNEEMEWIGTMERSEAHAKGVWHRTFHCWVLLKENDEYYVLVQKRHKDKDVSPNKLDITAAGHLSAGEEVSEGVREVEEELGLVINFEELHHIGVIPIKLRDRNVLDCEFCYTYLTVTEQRVQDFILKEDEVSGLFKIKTDDFQKLMTGVLSEAVATGTEMSEGTGNQEPVTINVTPSDFVQLGEDYYKIVTGEIMKYINS